VLKLNTFMKDHAPDVLLLAADNLEVENFRKQLRMDLPKFVDTPITLVVCVCVCGYMSMGD
jgi:hypothetical protein